MIITGAVVLALAAALFVGLRRMPEVSSAIAVITVDVSEFQQAMLRTQAAMRQFATTVGESFVPAMQRAAEAAARLNAAMTREGDA